jgi:hypothetical protein
VIRREVEMPLQKIPSRLQPGKRFGLPCEDGILKPLN